MPADPGAKLGAEKLPTKKEDVGHIAPSFDAPKRFNTLVLRPDLRLSLRLGSIEELFPSEPATPVGRMARLQVLGMFGWPLEHRVAKAPGAAAPAPADIVPGIPGPVTAAPQGAAYAPCWDWFKTRILAGADDAAADARIQELLRDWVVGSGDAVTGAGGGRLPAATEEGVAPTEAAGNFARVRIPGTYTFSDHWNGSGINPNKDATYPSMGWTDDIFAIESRYYQDNIALGKIPLIATVEKLDPLDNAWKPLKDATVYFQLVPSYDLPAFDTTRDASNVLAKPANTQINRPPLRATTLGPPAKAAGAGPQLYTTAKETNYKPAPADPQGTNCHKDFGGRRGNGSLDDGSDVFGHIFHDKAVPGFNGPPVGKAGSPARATTRTNFFPTPQRVNDAARKHAVKAKTNADGEAGVLFTPSRAGGDRYRFRVFVGPPTLTGPGDNGEGAAAVRVETGTLVSWRSIRVSRSIRQPDSNIHADLITDASTNGHFWPHPFVLGGVNYDHGAGATDAKKYGWLFKTVDPRTNATVGLSNLDLHVFSDGAGGSPFEGFVTAYSKAFGEVIFDPGWNDALSDAEWTAGITGALSYGEWAQQNVTLTNFDLGRLCYRDVAAINRTNSHASIPMRSPAAYNTAVNALPAASRRALFTTATPATLATEQASVNTILQDFMLHGFLKSLTKDGYIPGLTMVHGAFGGTWQAFRLAFSNSGMAYPARGGFVWLGAGAYSTTIGSTVFSYGFNSNYVHESGHTIYRTHAPGQDSNGSHAGVASQPRHDNTAFDANGNPLADTCVMSYRYCEGMFCAKCLFGFRGWDITAAQMNPPPPNPPA